MNLFTRSRTTVIAIPGVLLLATASAGCPGQGHSHFFAVSPASRAELTAKQVDLSTKSREVRAFLQTSVPAGEAHSSFFMGLELPLAKADFYSQLVSELNAANGDVESLKIIATIGVLRALDRDLRNFLALQPSTDAETATQAHLKAVLDSVMLNTDAMSRAYTTAQRDGTPSVYPQERTVFRMQLSGAYVSSILSPAGRGGPVTSKVTCPAQTTPGSVKATLSLSGGSNQSLGGFSDPIEGFSVDKSGTATLGATAAGGAIIEGGGSAIGIDLPDLDAGDCTVEIVSDNLRAIPALYFSAQLEDLKFFASNSDSIARRIFATTQAIRSSGVLGNDTAILRIIETYALERLNRMALLRAYADQDHFDGEITASVELFLRLGRVEGKSLIDTLDLRDGSFRKIGDLLDQLSSSEATILARLKQ